MNNKTKVIVGIAGVVVLGYITFAVIYNMTRPEPQATVLASPDLPSFTPSPAPTALATPTALQPENDDPGGHIAAACHYLRESDWSYGMAALKLSRLGGSEGVRGARMALLEIQKNISLKSTMMQYCAGR